MKHLTLEECKALREAGFPQDTYFAYQTLPSGNAHIRHRVSWPDYSDWTKSFDNERLIACPTEGELLEALPKTREYDFGNSMRPMLGEARLTLRPFDDEWEAYYMAYSEKRHQQIADTPASALCALWLAVKGK